MNLTPVLTLVCFTIFGLNAQSHKIAPTLLQDAGENEKVDFLIVLNSQANTDAAYQLKSKTAKGQYVFQKLQKVAQNSQSNVIDILSEERADYKAFYIMNVIAAKGDVKLMNRLATLEEVKEIIPDPWVKMEEPVEVIPTIAFREGIEWGIQKINADQVWELGFTGQNVIIGGQDTGYDWEHPALRNQYNGVKGEGIDHSYSWHDAINEISPLHRDSIIDASNNPCGLNVNEPCDDGIHGTHTMGTMIGDDRAGNQIGVAPGAKWIGCRCMERGWGKPSTYIECFQWFLAPTDTTGSNPDPRKAPHVINNSWGCPEVEGCNASNWAVMEMVINNLRAAGVVVVVSAGNSGSNCNSVSSPAAMFEKSLTVGATASNDTIARFSSRGTVMVDGSGRTKPDVAAPGVSVRSAITNNRYASLSGTSMAGPHVAGAVALLISANPDLAGDADMIQRILERMAVPMPAIVDCDPNSDRMYPNNTYGYGRIDILAAVKEALTLVSTSGEDNLQNQSIKVFPNPFVGEISVLTDQIEGKVLFKLFDSMGRQVTQKEWMDISNDLLFLDVDPDLSAGVYYYQLIDENRKWTGKLMKQ